MKPVFAIMVTYRRFEHFKRTVESLVPTLPAGSMMVVVDNHSPADEWVDSYLKYFKEEMPKLKVVFHPMSLDTNKGWGAAMNEGLRMWPQWKDYEYVLETNNDVDYEPDWLPRAREVMEAHPEIGILGLWAHPYHHVRETLGDGVVIKDDMPATAWFFRSKDLQEFLPFPEHGPTKTRGGNGEDTAFRDKVQNKLGRWIAWPGVDLAHHMDGYDIPDLGKENPAYL